VSATTHIFFDGQSAGAKTVTLALSGDQFAIVGEDGLTLAIWPANAIRVASENAVNRSMTLRLDPDRGARLQVADGPDKEMIRTYFPAIRNWRRRERATLFKGFALWGSLGIAVCVLAYFGWGIASIAIADRMPDAWEQRLGDNVQAILVSESRVCKAVSGQNAIERLANKLRPPGLQGKSLKVIVVKSEIPNAFAIPGRRIVIFSGLIDLSDDANMLSGVLAHEMAHAELRHPIRGVVHQLGVGSVIGLIFGDSTIAGAGQIALALSYTRDIEREADAHGTEILKAAGLRADGLSRFLDKIKNDKSFTPLLPDFFSTHPDLGERVQATQQPAEGMSAMPDDEWQQVKAICSKS